jgi:hypothetical protein
MFNKRGENLMDNYEYVVLAKADFMEGGHTDIVHEDPLDTTSPIKGGKTYSDEFNVNNFQKRLVLFGKEGYRVITKLYNSPHDWVLILSRPLCVPAERGSGRTDIK